MNEVQVKCWNCGKNKSTHDGENCFICIDCHMLGEAGRPPFSEKKWIEDRISILAKYLYESVRKGNFTEGQQMLSELVRNFERRSEVDHEG